MLVAVYGGSFDPPHVGHAMVASWLLWTEQVGQVWLVPTFSHAFSKPLSPFRLRLAMCRALAADLGPRARVLSIERELPAPSYTLHTLDELSRGYPQHEFRLVVGADVLQQVGEWKGWDRIQSCYSPIIVGRSGFPPVNGSPSFPAVSSTEIRRLVVAGESVSHLVTAKVLKVMTSAGP